MKKRPEPHSKSEATRLIKAIARDKEGMVKITGHAKKRMKQREVDMLDILCAFRNGRILENPVWDVDNNKWKYKFSGNNVNGETLAIITNINEKKKHIALITIFKEKK